MIKKNLHYIEFSRESYACQLNLKQINSKGECRNLPVQQLLFPSPCICCSQGTFEAASL